MNIAPYLIGLGNLLKNSDMKNRKDHDGHVDPKYMAFHSQTFHSGIVYQADIDRWALRSAYVDTDHSSSYFWCVPIKPGWYTAYARVKPEVTGVSAMFLMHCYDYVHSTATQNVVQTQVTAIPDGVWTELTFQFEAPEYARYLHYSPRGYVIDDAHVLFADCKLVRGQKTIDEIKNAKSILPLVTNIHTYA
jgi:hypothetical protein